MSQAKARTATTPAGHSREANSLGITGDGLMLYNASPSRGRKRPEDVNSRYWVWCTSPIVGLFFSEKEAWNCLSSGERRPYSVKWRYFTDLVLKAIGEGVTEDYPFVLSTYDPLQKIALEQSNPAGT